MYEFTKQNAERLLQVWGWFRDYNESLILHAFEDEQWLEVRDWFEALPDRWKNNMKLHGFGLEE